MDNQASKIEPWESDLSHLQWLDDTGLRDWSGKQILDLGCGSGYLCEMMSQSGAREVCGIDIVPPKGADKLQWHYQTADLDAADWSEKIQKIGNHWDLILAFDIIEHLSSPYHFLVQIKSLLSPEGRVIVTTPNTSSWERLSNPKNWSGASDVQHKTLFTSYSLQFLANRCGLQVESLQAPIRKLGPINKVIGNWGGQLMMVASLKK